MLKLAERMADVGAACKMLVQNLTAFLSLRKLKGVSAHVNA